MGLSSDFFLFCSIMLISEICTPPYVLMTPCKFGLDWPTGLGGVFTVPTRKKIDFSASLRSLRSFAIDNLFVPMFYFSLQLGHAGYLFFLSLFFLNFSFLGGLLFFFFFCVFLLNHADFIQVQSPIRPYDAL